MASGPDPSPPTPTTPPADTASGTTAAPGLPPGVEVRPAQPSFGIDAPGVVLAFTVMAVVSLFGMVFAAGGNAPPLVLTFGICVLITAGSVTAMVLSSRSGKAKVWGRTLDALGLAGDEQALDLGCGRGLVLVELARRLPEGSVDGVDIWRSKDQSGNGRAIAESNMSVTGVSERVTIHDADMRDLPFPDRTFDLVTAGMSIHNIPDRQGRARALAEAVRVLRPAGRLVVVDIAKVDEYRSALAALGLAVDPPSAFTFAIYPPARVLVATRPVDATPPSPADHAGPVPPPDPVSEP